VGTRLLEQGQLRLRIRVTRTYDLPERISGRRRVGSKPFVVETTIELRAGEPFVRLTTACENAHDDHRLRTWLPLPERASTSTAECVFGTVTRGTEAEGGPTERALPTYPARRFVQAGGLTVLHEAITEYELVDVAGDGTAGSIALTLLRATGMLSQVEMAYRPLPAGPPVALEGSQVRQRITTRWGVAVGDVDPWALADDAFLPLEVVRSAGIGPAADSGAMLKVRGAEVSAVRREAGVLEVRVFNPGDDVTTVAVDGTGWLVDLRGRPVEPFDGAFELRGRGIATARLTGRG
jgi:mannosylglycerate hydrolase